MDTFFLSHGSPMLSVDESLPARHFFESWRSKVLPAAPTAILVVSGHWETASPTVNAIDGSSDTIHDFYNFPKRLYEFKYPAPGAPHLARRVKELLQNAGFEHVKEDNARGLDHGAWIPLMLMYPEAGIPVCQLSVQTELDVTHHFNMGKALAPLRDEGVLIIGSGSATHNLRMISRENGPAAQWASDFDTWLKEALLGGRYDEVNNYMEKAPNARMAQPKPDHFYPLHVALGAAGERAKAELIHHSWSNSNLSYSSYSLAKSSEIDQLRNDLKQCAVEIVELNEVKSRFEALSSEHQHTCEELRKLQEHVSIISREKDELSSLETVIGQELMVKARTDSNEMEKRILQMELQMHKDSLNYNKERTKLRMQLRSMQATLDAYRGRYREVVDEMNLMNKKYEEASTKLKKQLGQYGVEILNLKKQLVTK